MTKNTLLVQTQDRNELRRFSGAIRQLRAMNMPIVFARRGVDSKVVTHELIADAKACGFSDNEYTTIPVVKKSLMSELSTRGMAIGVYLGKSPELIGKESKKPETVDKEIKEIAPEKKQEPVAEKSPLVQYRYAVLCKNCECVLHENKTRIPMNEAIDKLNNLMLISNLEVEQVEGSINAIEYDNCERGC